MGFHSEQSWGNMRLFSSPKAILGFMSLTVLIVVGDGASFAKASDVQLDRLKTMGILLASPEIGRLVQEEPIIPDDRNAPGPILEGYDESMIDDERDMIPEASEVEEVRVVPEQEPHHHHHSHPKPEDISRMSKSLSLEDEKRASELCGTSASLECGKRILGSVEGQSMSDLTVHTKCDLRDEFLQCIGKQKRDCLELASANVFPQLPPKEVIKMEQGKLWKILWTAGGCVLED